MDAGRVGDIDASDEERSDAEAESVEAARQLVRGRHHL